MLARVPRGDQKQRATNKRNANSKFTRETKPRMNCLSSCWRSLLCFRSVQAASYQPLHTLPLDASAIALFKRLSDGVASDSLDATESVRLEVGEHMETWSALLGLCVDAHLRGESDLRVLQWLLEDSGVHILFWSNGPWFDAAKRNDKEMVDVWLHAFRKQANQHNIDAHFVCTRTSNLFAGAATGGHTHLIEHIHRFCIVELGMMFVTGPMQAKRAGIDTSVLEKVDAWFDQRHQLAFYNAVMRESSMESTPSGPKRTSSER